MARLYAGYFLLMSGTTKIERGYLFGGALLPQLQRFVSGTPPEWYKAWLVQVVIPHERLFAVLTAVGETLVGTALVLGALTRLSAVAGIFMVANYLLAKGWGNPAASLDKTFIVLLLVVLLGGAGEHWGIDGWRRRKR